MKQIISILICCGVLGGNVRGQEERPNIIFLFADDQRADAIGIGGNEFILTPNLDQLAEKGMYFTSNYCAGSFSGAVCVASRAMLMTGCHWKHIPGGNKGGDWKDLPLLPKQLRAEGGYNTFMVGKWHNGRENLKKAFPEGRSIYLGGMANHESMEVQDIHDGVLNEKYKAASFSSTSFADAAIDYIRDYHTEEPFFLYVAFTAPHDPRNPPVENREYYYDHRPPLPANFLPLHPFKNAPWIQMQRDESLAPWPRTKEVISDQLCEYYGLVTHLDEQVGRIMKALDESPHAENTIVIYTADHGLAMGSHGLLGKQNIYEQSMMSPLIICGPGVPDQAKSQAFTYIHDLYSTICDFAQIDIPDQVDSRSLLPIIRGSEIDIRSSLYLPFQDNQRAINDGKWKLHIYPQINHRLLFKIEEDPHEMHNLAENPEYQDEIERLTALMEDWRREIGDSDPLRVDHPESKEVDYTQFKRVLDQWQPQWIIDKYFSGIQE